MKFDQYYLECLSHASNLIGDESSNKAVVVDAEKSRKACLDWLNTARPTPGPNGLWRAVCYVRPLRPVQEVYRCKFVVS